MTDFAEQYLTNIRLQFRSYRAMAEKAMAQVDDEAFFVVPYHDGNSVAILVKHMAGNMRSRWLDFFTADGEKPDRNRDTEFEIEAESRSDLMAAWARSWDILFGILDPLSPADLGRTITIRSEPHNVIEAVNRQLTHYAYHIGQIVLLARHHAGDDWQTLSVARGATKQFNEMMRRKHGGESASAT